MDSYKLIPKHSRDKNARFYHEGVHNKPLPPSTDSDPLELILVLQGGIRVDIEALNKKVKHALGVDRTDFASTTNKHNHKKKAAKSEDNINDRHEKRRQQIALEAALEARKKEEMVVLTGTLPLLRQGEGSLLFVTPAAKMVGMKDEDYDDDAADSDEEEVNAELKQKRPDVALSALLMLSTKQSQQQQAAQAQRNNRAANNNSNSNNKNNNMHMLSTESSVDDLSLHSTGSLSLHQQSGSHSPLSSSHKKNHALLSPAANNAKSSNIKGAVNSSAKKAIKESPLYKINLICEGPTAFLRIPYRYLQRILNEDSISRGLILRSIANTVQGQLVRAGERIVTRIKGLLPWLGPPPPELLMTEKDMIEGEDGDLDLIDAEAREKKRQAMDGVLHLPPPRVPVSTFYLTTNHTLTLFACQTYHRERE